jgi:hypothetical protein
LFDGELVSERALLHGAHGHLLATARRPIGLRINGEHAMARGEQRFERRHGELRSAGEN